MLGACLSPVQRARQSFLMLLQPCPTTLANSSGARSSALWRARASSSKPWLDTWMLIPGPSESGDRTDCEADAPGVRLLRGFHVLDPAPRSLRITDRRGCGARGLGAGRFIAREL